MIPELKGKVLVLGIGNTLKQDDGAGPYFVRNFKPQTSKSKHNIELIDAGSAPENFTGQIKRIKPDTLVIVDAVEFGAKPGSIRVMGEGDLRSQSLSTHNVSLKTFVDFLRADLPDLKVHVIGIQPKQADFGEGLSPEVEKAVAELCTNFI
ncbi:hydrogenase maturation peptidase HycI [Candidatus Margulisiibacteriota bacterium]